MRTRRPRPITADRIARLEERFDAGVLPDVADLAADARAELSPPLPRTTPEGWTLRTDLEKGDA